MQKSFSDLEYAAKRKLTQRDRFLTEIDSVTPWDKLHKLIEPFFPKVEGAGRPPTRLAVCYACTLPSSVLVCRTKASGTRSTTASPLALSLALTWAASRRRTRRRC